MKPSPFLRNTGIILGFIATLLAGIAYGITYLRNDILLLRWDRPLWFIALVLIPIVLYEETIGQDARVPRLLVGSIRAARKASGGWRKKLRDVPGVLRAGALALVVMCLARPQSISLAEIDERTGIDIMIALDLSGSMRAADLKPTRLAAAKAVVQELIEKRQNDRIGAVVFAKDAFLLSPLTFDHQRVAQQIGRMQLGVISGDGTAIGDGLAMSLAKLRHSKASSRVIVLLTDGDNNAGSTSPEYSIDAAKDLKVRIYTVQMGNGDEVDVEAGRDVFGRPVYGRAKFPVKPELLKKIASETKGEFYIATQTEELRSSMHKILDSLKKTTFESATSDVVDRFPLLLIPAVLLLVFEALLRAFVLRRFP